VSYEWGVHRTVILEDVAEEALDILCQKFEKFDVAYEALEWLLSRNPRLGKKKEIDEERWFLYVQGADILANTPEIWVIYQYDDNEVTIYNLHAV